MDKEHCRAKPGRKTDGEDCGIEEPAYCAYVVPTDEVGEGIDERDAGHQIED